MQTPILALAGHSTGPSVSATRHAALAGGAQTGQWENSATLVQIPVPLAGTFSNLRIRFPAAIADGDTWTVTLQAGGADTTLTTPATNANSGVSADTVNAPSVAAGDLMSLKCVPANTPDAQGRVQISLVFTATASGKSVMFGRQDSGNATATFYLPVGTAGLDTLTTEASAEVVMPCDGTLDVWYGRLSAVPGGTATRTYTVRKNGVDTDLILAFGAADQALNDSGSVAFVAGDRLTVSCATANGPATAAFGFGIGWTPAVDGESVLLFRAGALSNSTTVYGNTNGNTSTGQTTESDAYNVAPVAFTVRKMQARLSTAPGAGKSRAFTSRKNGGSEALTCTVADAATTASDTSNSFSVAAGDLLTRMQVPTGTPTAVSSATVGTVAYIAPAAAAGPQPSKYLLSGVS